MKINGMVKNKVLSRLKNITEENDLKNFTFGGGIRDLDEYIDDLMRQRNNTNEKLFGGVQAETHRTINPNENRTLFTPQAIMAASRAASMNNKNREEDYER